MAIYINGQKVAGRGVSGKSPYQVAVEGGYTGSEADFNQQLAAIGAAVSEVNEKISECERLIAQANQTIENAQNEFDAAIESARQQIASMVSAASDAATAAQQAAQDAQATADAAEEAIADALADALAQIEASSDYVTNSVLNTTLSSYATKTYVDESIANNVDFTGYATEDYVDDAIAAMVSDIWYYGSSSPDTGYSGDEATKRQKLFWIDSNTTTGGLKYYRNGSWIHVPVAWQ